MLMMNEEYAKMRDEKAKRTVDWLVDKYNLQPIEPPTIATMTIKSAEILPRPVPPPAEGRRVRTRA